MTNGCPVKVASVNNAAPVLAACDSKAAYPPNANGRHTIQGSAVVRVGQLALGDASDAWDWV